MTQCRAVRVYSLLFLKTLIRYTYEVMNASFVRPELPDTVLEKNISGNAPIEGRGVVIRGLGFSAGRKCILALALPNFGAIHPCPNVKRRLRTTTAENRQDRLLVGY